MNLILMQCDSPPLVIKKEERGEYIEAIEKAEKDDDLADFYKICFESLNRSLDSYLKAVEKE